MNQATSAAVDPCRNPASFDTSSVAEEFRALVASRRSVRRFSDEEIPETVILDAIQLGKLAPNSSNLQPWEFHVVRRKASGRFVEACLNQNAARTASHLIVVVADAGCWKKHSRQLIQSWPTNPPPPIVRRYYNTLVPLMYTQGPLSIIGRLRQLIVTVLRPFRPTYRPPCSNADMITWATKSAALAAAHIMLGLKAHGYDSCAMEGFDDSRIRHHLGLRRGKSVTMILAVGTCAPQGIYSERVRFPDATDIHFH